MAFSRTGYQVERRRPLDLMRADADFAHPAARWVPRVSDPRGRGLVDRLMAERNDEQRSQSAHNQTLVRKLLVVLSDCRWSARESREHRPVRLEHAARLVILGWSVVYVQSSRGVGAVTGGVVEGRSRDVVMGKNDEIFILFYFKPRLSDSDTLGVCDKVFLYYEYTSTCTQVLLVVQFVLALQ